ncbi:MAG: hypothetical protein WCH98_16575, partial [Verrucomicrobiota bacterium]
AFPRAGVAAVFAAPREARPLDLPEVALIRDAHPARHEINPALSNWRRRDHNDRSFSFTSSVSHPRAGSSHEQQYEKKPSTVETSPDSESSVEVSASQPANRR